jgi:hypothetical protein
VKVLFFAMLVHTLLYNTFEDGKKALYGVGMNGRIGK